MKLLILASYEMKTVYSSFELSLWHGGIVAYEINVSKTM